MRKEIRSSDQRVFPGVKAATLTASTKRTMLLLLALAACLVSSLAHPHPHLGFHVVCGFYAFSWNY